MATNQPVDVLVIGAGASVAALAWSLARAGIGVLCLEQGDWVDAKSYPHWQPDWELHRNTDWSAEPNVRLDPASWKAESAGKRVLVVAYQPEKIRVQSIPTVVRGPYDYSLPGAAQDFTPQHQEA